MSFIWPQYETFLDEMILWWAVILLPVGLTVLVKGADWLVDGAVAIAKHLKMSPLIIGLTIVAMGTSAPEIAASIKAAIDNSPGIAVGNVYGSNIANLALVGGLCAIIRPIRVSRPALLRDIPLMLAVALILIVYFYDEMISRSESVTMLVLFTTVIGYMICSERKQTSTNHQKLSEKEHEVDAAAPHQPKSIFVSSLLVLFGLFCLSEGANLTVESAKVIGRSAGMSPGVIGATIIAVGTSLPELMTCLIAAFRGHDDLSVGNLVGSNIFNTLLVIGASGMVKPYSIADDPELAGSYYWLMIAVLMLFSVIAFMTKKISRTSGLILAAVYAGYILYSLFGIRAN